MQEDLRGQRSAIADGSRVQSVRDVAPEATNVATGSNADAGGSGSDAAARELAEDDGRMILVPSLGVERY